MKPTFAWEEKFWSQGLNHVAGVDEAGRGALAGPLVAAAVILPPVSQVPKAFRDINDSKLLTSAQRNDLFPIIIAQAVVYSIISLEVEIIDQLGMGKAGKLALKQAVTSLTITPDHTLVDYYSLDLAAQTPIKFGDRISLSIAAASILAKVYRDQLVVGKLHPQYPDYRFDQHKGYGTKLHREKIREYGPSPCHRRSFRLPGEVSAAGVTN